MQELHPLHLASRLRQTTKLKTLRFVINSKSSIVKYSSHATHQMHLKFCTKIAAGKLSMRQISLRERVEIA